MKILKCKFIDSSNNPYSLFYSIYDNDLTNRWIQMIEKNLFENKKIISKITNKTFKDVHLVRSEINECILKINKIYDNSLPLYTNVDIFDVNVLNYLHEQFEIYGDRIDELSLEYPLTRWSKEMHENFLRLNELIHLHEDVIKSKEVPFPNAACLFDLIPQEHHSPILERDKLYLKSDLQWGKLYLGYNTLGKDWIKACVDNDLELVEREQVRPQKRFAAEAWLNFGPDTDMYQYSKFEKWYLSLDESLRNKIPINNLNSLCLGRFEIGKIIIDNTFLRFDYDRRNWNIPNSDTKLRWNQEVFSTFRKLIDIEIINE
jgi:hypothetical protein